MIILPNADDAVILPDKFTKYILHPVNSRGKHIAFERALGYNINNYDKLICNILQNIKNYPVVEKPDKGHGKRYAIDMELTGENGKTARVVTAWIDDTRTGEMRLTSAYVKTRKDVNDVNND